MEKNCLTPLARVIGRTLSYATIPALFTCSAVAQDVQQMETIVVTAQALKIETPAQETPKAVSIIDEDTLKARAPQKLDEALRYTAGVTAQPYGSDNDTDWFKVRGFDAASYLDGSRLFRDGYYTWLLEPYGLQQVEVVKGPSAILFGDAPPGGVVNAIQKKPTYSPQGEVRLEVGNNSHHSIAFDLSDVTNQQGNMRYRLVGLFKNSDGELNGSENERFYLAPSLEIDLSDSTMLTLMATYLHDDGVPTNGFFPVAGTLKNADLGSIDPSTNLGEPDYDQYQRTQISVGYLLEHELNDLWTLSQNFNYGYNELFLRSTYAFPNADPSATELGRGVVFRDGDNQSFSLDNKALANWFGARSEQTLLAGVELQYHKNRGEEQENYSFSSINPWNPVYGNYTPLDATKNIDRRIEKSQLSLYSQYQMKWELRWIGLLGARQDWVSTENQSKKGKEEDARNDSQLSLNAGVMYLSDLGLSPYASYSQSFEVLSTIDKATLQLYKPLEGEQVEVGVKYTPSFVDGYLNVAWFDIEQKNALVTNPAASGKTQTGKITSEGVEVELVAQVSGSTKVSAAYTYTEAKTDETGGKGHQQVALIPKHSASLWVDYNAAFVGINGLNIGSGVRYIGESKDNPVSSNLTVPSATLIDLAASYDLSANWQAQLNINNLLDKEYISGCDYYCYFGQSRSVVLSANYRW